MIPKIKWHIDAPKEPSIKNMYAGCPLKNTLNSKVIENSINNHPKACISRYFETSLYRGDTFSNEAADIVIQSHALRTPWLHNKKINRLNPSSWAFTLASFTNMGFILLFNLTPTLYVEIYIKKDTYIFVSVLYNYLVNSSIWCCCFFTTSQRIDTIP